ncbi:MAG: hypothetical protein HKN70_06575 [Gammaproteobacteria bacterium]|nr:hypothetical protein [Gammaproteobacteria bacterium]
MVKINLMIRLLPIVIFGSSHALAESVPAASDDRVSAFTRAADLLEENRFEEAGEHCDQWHAAVAAAEGEGSVNLVAPITCLGHVYFGLDQLLKSASHFERAIKLLEENIGVFASELRAPLEGLGNTLSTLKQYDAALSVYLRAKDITHRNEGVFNLVQTNISNRLTEIYAWTEDLSAADREQRFLLHANEENYGNTPQLTPALKHMARWHMIMQREDHARKQYRRALAILEAAYGPNDIRLAGPLNDIANSFLQTPRDRRVMSGEGVRALKRVISLYENQEYPDMADVARAWARLGDWHVRGGHRGRAQQAYEQAWNKLNSVRETPLDVDSMFDEPLELEFEAHPVANWRPSQILRLPPGNLEIVFSFTVDKHGRVRDLNVIKDDVGSSQLMTALRSNVRSSRYRPRILDGVPVATDNVIKTIKYNFDSARDAILAKRQAAVVSDNEEDDAAKLLDGNTDGVAVAPAPETDADTNEESTGNRP